MLLAVDIGNTNIVLGAYENDELKFISRIMTSRDKTADEMAVVIRDVLRLYHVEGADFTGCIVSSVVPPVTASVVPALERITHKKTLVVGPGVKTGLNIKVDDPAQLGADPVVDAVAALGKYKKPLIILDMGTATTISVINEKGEYLGGSIHPGVRLAYEALSTRAAQLPVISIEAPQKVIGSNTVDCMRAGAVYGEAAMIDGMIDRIESELGQKCTAVATGGLSYEITKHTKHEVIHDPNLLLDGLKMIYDRNK